MLNNLNKRSLMSSKIYYYQINKTIFFSVDSRPFSQQPKVLSPKVNKMLCKVYENVGNYLKIKYNCLTHFKLTTYSNYF